MKEAVGSTQLLRIVLIFLAVYIMFMATIINYTTTFRVKNQIVTIIERQEGFDEDAVNSYLLNTARYTSHEGSYGPNGKKYDVEKISTERGPYYVVTTYVNFELPLVNNVLTFAIRGETRVLYNLR